MAWKSELQSIMDWAIFSKPVIVPEGYNTITTKIVKNVKYFEDVNIARYKPYLVVCDFTQIYGVNYKEIFAITIYYNTLCIFFAIFIKNNWKIYQVNIVTIFLAEKLNKVMYF